MTDSPQRNSLRAKWYAGFAAFACALGASVTNAAQVSDIRVWESPDHTRVVVDLNGPAKHQVRVLQNPDRIAVDLRGTQRRGGNFATIPGRGIVQRVRTGVQDGHNLRIVVDLQLTARPSVFMLPPTSEYGHRLVIDLEPATASPVPARSSPPAVSAALPSQDTRPAQESSRKPAPTLAPARSDNSAERTAQASPVKLTQKTVVVAIDAGHGGEDHGARGPRGTREKDVALAISRKLAKRINAEPGMRAALVRDGDYYVGLRQRMIKARKQQADLFVSVHADAHHNRSANGASVYVLSQRGASSEHARWLAEKENASDLIGGVRIRDKDDGLAAFMLDLSQDAAIEASFDVGSRVLRHLGGIGKLHKRSVQQAGFLVLKSPDIPSLLVETAFISNRNEEARLRDPSYQDKLASAVFGGVKGYFATYRPAATVASAP